MDQLAEQVQRGAAQVSDHVRDVVSQVQQLSVQDAPLEQLSSKLRELSKLQKRNLAVVAFLGVLAALVRQKKAAGLALLINLVAFRVHAWPLQSETSYDTVGALTNLSLMLFSILAPKGPLSKSQIVNTVSSAMWSTRLGVFLLTRILLTGRDDRFLEIKKDHDSLLLAFVLQALWCFVGQLPLLVSNSQSSSSSKSSSSSSSEDESRIVSWPALGRALFVLGMGLEVVSDAQKMAFQFQNKGDSSKFICDGLWKYSRHPNYLGEILLQTGLTLTCSENFVGLGKLAWLSPLLTTVLLTSVSGIPMVEASALKRFGNDPKYQDYLLNTPVLFPKIF